MLKDFLAENKEYKFKKLPESDSISTTFPYKNILSHFIGPSKVYPELEKYLRTDNPEGCKMSITIEMYGKENTEFV